MKLCIAGKNTIAVNILEYFIALQKENKNYELVCVLNKNEIGKNGWQKSLKWHCERYGIKICKLEELYEEPDLIFLSLEFDQIIKPSRFQSKSLFNIHFSLLPKYKGVYPTILPILYDENETGVTLHRIRSGIDTGEIIAQKRFPVQLNDTAYDIYEKCIETGSKLIIENLPKLLGEKPYTVVKQPAEKSTYYSRDAIDFKKLRVNLNRTAYQIHNQVRAFAFRPYQFIKWENIDIIHCDITDHTSKERPGTILEENDRYLRAATIDYDIILYKDCLKALLNAIQLQDNEKVKRLCELKKLIYEKNEQGWTPLIVAVYNNNQEIVRFLLKHGASIQDKNYNGTNLLMYAKDCYKNTGDSRLFKMLLKQGIKPEEKDIFGKNVIDYCLEEGIYQIGDVDILSYNNRKENTIEI